MKKEHNDIDGLKAFLIILLMLVGFIAVQVQLTL